MKKSSVKKALIALLAVVLVLSLFAACGKNDNDGTTAAPTASAPVTDSTPTDSTAANTTASTPVAATGSSTADAKVAFPAGTWENSSVKYTFNADGSGSTEDPATGTGTPFNYEVASDKNVLTIHFGSADESEEVAYAVSGSALALTFADGRVITLNPAAEKAETASIVGTWKNSDLKYTFNADGTGSNEDPATGMGTPFTYEAADGSMTIHFGSSEDSETASYSISGNTLTLTFADGNVFTLNAVA